MKRGGPLQRRTPLRAKKPLERGSSELKRTPLRSKPKKRKSAAEKAESDAWWNAVTDSGRARCVVTGRRGTREDPIEAHHVIRKGWLKDHGHADKLWDVRNGVPVIRSVHARHTNAFERLPRSVIPEAAVDFAREVAAEHVFEVEYPL